MKRIIPLSLVGRFCGYRFVVSVCLTLASFGAVSEGLDSRQIIQLNDMQRAHVLGEMRALLSGTQGILASLAANDMAEAARQARLLGMGNKQKAESTVHGALPPAFMQMGMSLHRTFDAIATDVEAGADVAQTLAQLSKAMNGCTSCHEIYQIQRVAVQQPLQPADED